MGAGGSGWERGLGAGAPRAPNLRSESTGESNRASTGYRRVVAEAHVRHVEVHILNVEGAAHVAGLAAAYLGAMEADVDTCDGEGQRKASRLG